MTDENIRQELATLRQQVRALASVSGVLLAALRRGGLMAAAPEELLSAGIVDAAAAASAEVRRDWQVVFTAVQGVAAETARSAHERGET